MNAKTKAAAPRGLQPKRFCAGCGRVLKQKYFKECIYCQKAAKKEAKAEQKLAKKLQRML